MGERGQYKALARSGQRYFHVRNLMIMSGLCLPGEIAAPAVPEQSQTGRAGTRRSLVTSATIISTMRSAALPSHFSGIELLRVLTICSWMACRMPATLVPAMTLEPHLAVMGRSVI